MPTNRRRRAAVRVLDRETIPAWLYVWAQRAVNTADLDALERDLGLNPFLMLAFVGVEVEAAEAILRLVEEDEVAVGEHVELDYEACCALAERLSREY